MKPLLRPLRLPNHFPHRRIQTFANTFERCTLRDAWRKKRAELFKPDQVGLTSASPKDFFTIGDPVIWDVVSVARSGTYDVEGSDRMAHLYAADFWARLQGKPPVDHVE